MEGPVHPHVWFVRDGNATEADVRGRTRTLIFPQLLVVLISGTN